MDHFVSFISYKYWVKNSATTENVVLNCLEIAANIKHKIGGKTDWQQSEFMVTMGPSFGVHGHIKWIHAIYPMLIYTVLTCQYLCTCCLSKTTVEM